MAAPFLTHDIKKCVALLRQGRVVAFPTGTSYGLAVDALQGNALQRLRNLKQRPQEKTFTVFLDESQWDDFFLLTATEYELLEKYRQQPLTLLVEPKDSLAHLAQDSRIGLRIIDHPLMAKLAKTYRSPLTATSANISGEEPCYSPTEIQQKFPGKVDATTYNLSLACILNAGELTLREPSTIAKLENKKIKIIRSGALRLQGEITE